VTELLWLLLVCVFENLNLKKTPAQFKEKIAGTPPCMSCCGQLVLILSPVQVMVSSGIGLCAWASEL
jgi:hypothetical protein